MSPDRQWTCQACHVEAADGAVRREHDILRRQLSRRDSQRDDVAVSLRQSCGFAIAGNAYSCVKAVDHIRTPRTGTVSIGAASADEQIRESVPIKIARRAYRAPSQVSLRLSLDNKSASPIEIRKIEYIGWRGTAHQHIGHPGIREGVGSTDDQLSKVIVIDVSSRAD